MSKQNNYTVNNKAFIEQYLNCTNKEDKRKIEGKLIDNHIKMIKSLVRTYCRDDNIEDGIQEGRIATMQAIRNYNPCKGSSITTYIHHKVTYSLIDMRKVQKGIHEVPLEHLAEKHIAREYTPLIGMIELLDRLNEREKIILTKKYIEGYTMKELEEELNIGRTQLYMIEKAALNQLKEWLSS